jgi:hypothetical protein
VVVSILVNTTRVVTMNSDPDMPVWGAEAIGKTAGVFAKDGVTVDLRRTYYLLEQKILDADKAGRAWVSTPRRIRRLFSGE